MKAWNVATDTVVNQILQQNNFNMLQGSIILDRIIKELKLKLDLNTEYSAEEIYHLIPKTKMKGVLVAIADSGFDNHSGNGSTEDVSIENRQAKEWQRRMITADQIAKSIGKGTNGIKRVLGAIEPKMDWRDILRNFIEREIPQDYTFGRPHKKSITSGFYLPDTVKEGINLAVIVDTSGSIGKKELKSFKGELLGIINSNEGLTARVYACDDEVHNHVDVDAYSEEEILDWKPEGCGGTDLRKGFKRIEEDDLQPKCVVVLTDMYTPFPEDFDVPVLWLSTTKISSLGNSVPKVGEVMEYEF